MKKHHFVRLLAVILCLCMLPVPLPVRAAEAPLTRGEMAQLLVDTLGVSRDPDSIYNWAQDVTPNTPHYEAILLCCKLELMFLYTEPGDVSTFRPNNSISRAEVAKCLYNACGSPVLQDSAPSIPDVSPDSWYVDFVQFCVGTGAMVCRSGGAFDPNGYAVRSDLHMEKIRDQLKAYNGKYFNRYDWQPDWFTEGQNWYNHNLAIASLNLASAAFNNGAAPSNGYASDIAGWNVKDQLLNLGFQASNIDISFYEGRPTSNSIAAAFGVRDVSFGQQTGHLLFIAVRGGGYEAEWGGNLKVGAKGNHRGFQQAADQVMVLLQNFLRRHPLSGRTALWITGYSRGAATANLLAGELLRPEVQRQIGLNVDQRDFYAYTFATPMGVAGNPEKDVPIYNIVNPIDVVPKVAPQAWKFGRHGRDMIFPCYSSKQHDSTYDALQTYYEQFTFKHLPKTFTPYKVVIEGSKPRIAKETKGWKKDHGYYLECLVNVSVVQDLVSSRKQYNKDLEITLSAVAEKFMGEYTIHKENFTPEVGEQIIMAVSKILVKKGILGSTGFGGHIINLFYTLTGQDRWDLCWDIADILVENNVVEASSSNIAYWLNEILKIDGVLRFLSLNVNELATGAKNKK